MGPTASGKSSVALSLAQNRGGVIINADSQQMYRNLRVLTARPSEAEEARAPHKLYGLLEADEACSAGKWLRYAKMEIDWALSQKATPIVCGGTGLYIKALMEGISEIPAIDDSVRDQASQDYEVMGKDAFSARLKEVDPGFFERLKVYDKQRLIRAYAVWLGTGKSLSWWQSQPQHAPYPAEIFELHQMDISRERLYERCDARLNIMVGNGALEEVKTLLSLQLNPDLPIMKTLGVKEFGAHLRGEMTLEAAVTATQQATRNYAKRQLTWLRNQLPGHEFTLHPAA